jgi:hypothetical protein
MTDNGDNGEHRDGNRDLLDRVFDLAEPDPPNSHGL